MLSTPTLLKRLWKSGRDARDAELKRIGWLQSKAKQGEGLRWQHAIQEPFIVSCVEKTYLVAGCTMYIDLQGSSCIIQMARPLSSAFQTPATVSLLFARLEALESGFDPLSAASGTPDGPHASTVDRPRETVPGNDRRPGRSRSRPGGAGGRRRKAAGWVGGRCAT